MNRAVASASRPSTAMLLGAALRRSTRLTLPAAALAFAASVTAPTANAVDRTWIGGNADWDGTGVGKWTGNDEPDPDDRAIFNTNNTVDMSIGNVIDGLVLSNGIDLATVNNALDVNGDISISGNSTFKVGGNDIAGQNSNLLDMEDLSINNNATFFLGGSRVEYVDADTGIITINSGGTLAGNGNLRNGDGLTSVTTVLNNNGTISVQNVFDSLLFLGVPAERTLQITSNDPDARVNLDGTGENGIINVFRNQTLDNNLTLSDTFSGTINLFHNSTLDFQNSWSFNGDMIVDNGFVAGTIISPDIPADVAFIDGAGTFTMSGGLIDVVDNDGALQFDTTTVLNGGRIDGTSGGRVIFAANTTINTAHDLDLGFNGNAVIDNNAIVTVNDDDFDMDGSSGADWTIRNGAELRIRGDNLDTTTGDADDRYDGQLTFQDDDGLTSTGGDQILDIDVADNLAQLNTIVVNSGTARIRSASNDNIELEGTVTIDNGASLVLDSNFVRFQAGGRVVGDGRLFFDDPVFIGDDTLIDVANLDIDNVNGTLTVNAGATLDLDATAIESPNSTFRINGGTADVSTAAYSFASSGDLLFTNSGADAPTYIGTGEVTFLSGSTLTSTATNALMDSDATFREGSRISIESATGQLELEGGHTFTFDGGEISETVNGGTVVLDGNMVVTGDTLVSVSTFDWDEGFTTISNGGLLNLNVDTIDRAAGDRYDAGLTLSDGDLTVFTAANQWTHDSTITANEATNIIRGDRMLIGDDVGTSDANINVNGAGNVTLRIEAPVTVNADADVFIGTGDTLVINNANTVFTPQNGTVNAEFTGSGTLRVVGAAFNENTTLNMTGGTVGLDGNLGANGGIVFNTPGDTDINAIVTINAATFDPFGFSSITGSSEINIQNQGELRVNIDGAGGEWQVLSNGIINYTDAGPIGGTFLRGDDLNLDGTLNVTGSGTTQAGIIIGGTVNINTAGRSFAIDEDSEMDGGVIQGAGTFVGLQESTLRGFGTINTAIDFRADSDDTSRLTAQGGTLALNGTILNMGDLQANNGTLQINTNYSTSTGESGIQLLNNGVLAGTGIITIDSSSVRGSGTVTSRLINNGAILGQSGTLVIDNAGTNLDGSGTEDGLVRALGGNVELRNFSDGENFNGRVNATNGQIFTNGEDIRFASDSDTVLSNGGSFRTNINTTFQGTLTSTGSNDLITNGAAQFTFGSSTNATLNNALGLEGNFRVNSGASISGGGSLDLLPGTLVLDNGSVISTLLNNTEGTVELGTGSTDAQVTVQDFQQLDDGTLGIDLNGVGLNQFDRMTLAGSGFLDGTLDVSVNFGASLGQTFAILTGFNFSGAFDTVNVSGLSAGLDLDVVYNPTSVILEIVNAVAGLAGDYNMSGSVEQADLDLVLTNWGGPRTFTDGVTTFATPNVDQEELDLVLTQWGSSLAPSFEGFSVPEPGAAALGLGLAGLALRRRRVA